MTAHSVQNALCRRINRAVQSAATGVFMATAAKLFRHMGNPDGTLAAQTDAYPLVRHLTQKYRNFDAGNPNGVVDDTLGIFVAGAQSNHVLMRYPEPRHASFALQRRQRCAQQSHFGEWVAEVQVLRNPRRAGAKLDQVIGQREGTGAGTFITK